MQMRIAAHTFPNVSILVYISFESLFYHCVCYLFDFVLYL